MNMITVKVYPMTCASIIFCYIVKYFLIMGMKPGIRVFEIITQSIFDYLFIGRTSHISS